MIKLFTHLFFPSLCQACDNILVENEDVICTSCRHHLPTVSNFFLTQYLQIDLLFDIELKTIFSLFYFQKGGLVQKLLHNLKYKNQQCIGVVMGKWLGEKIKCSNQLFGIDLVVLVPLHPKRQKKRGYNQVSLFAYEISKALNVPYCDNVLKKIKHTKTQVFQSKSERWFSVKQSFELACHEVISNKNLLLVDDIITTGATMKACILALNQGHPKSINLASIAIADGLFR